MVKNYYHLNISTKVYDAVTVSDIRKSYFNHMNFEERDVFIEIAKIQKKSWIETLKPPNSLFPKPQTATEVRRSQAHV